MALLTDDDVFGAPSASLLSDSDVFGEASPKPKQNTGIAGDIGTAIKRGVLQIPGMATGLADIAAAPVSIATGINRPVSRAADWIGEQTGFRPGKWAEDANAEYSPAMQQAQQNVEQAKGFLPTIGAVVQNPRVAAQVVAESLPSTLAGGLLARGAMGAVAGAEKLTALRAAAGSADAAVANAARRELLKSGAIAAGIGEGAITAGQQMAQTGYDVDPALAAGTALGAGIGTGVIGGLSGRVAGSALGRRLGLSDIETSMAAGTLGENASKAGIAGAVKRIGAGVVQEGLLEEAPQSYQEQVWQNIAAGKPWSEGAAEAAALGAVAGGVMGGAVNAIPRSAQPAEQPPAVQPIAQELAAAARIPDPQVDPVAAINHPASGAIVKATAEGVLSGAIPPNTPATPATPAAPPTAAVVAPPPQGLVAGVPITETTPAAPGSDTPVSTAATSPQTNQAEPAGVPTTGPTADASDQAQVAVPPAQGSEAQPATGAVAGEVRQGIASAAIPPLQYPKQTASIAGPLPQTATAMPVGRFGTPVQKPKPQAQKFVQPPLTAKAQPSETSVLPQTAAQMPVGKLGERANGVEAPKPQDQTITNFIASRTPAQLAYIAANGKPGYREAAKARMASDGAKAAAPAQEKSPDNAKEPWQMTREEWRASNGTDPRLVEIAERFSEVTRGNRKKPSPGDGRDMVSNGLAREITDTTGTTRVLTESGRSAALGHRKAIVAAIQDGKPVPSEVLADYPDLQNPQPPANVPPNVSADISPDISPGEDLKAARRAKLESLRKKAKDKAAPKNAYEAEVAIQDGNATREITGFMKEERDAQVKAAKVAAWRGQFAGNGAETIASGDISRSDYEKLGDLVYRGKLTAGRAVEMIDSASKAGVLDAKVAADMVKRISAFPAAEAPELAPIQQQAVDAQHIDGKEVEKATPAVIKEAVSEGAQKAGLDLRQAHAILLQQIDTAIASAPSEKDSGGNAYVAFKISKDTTDSIPNTKAHLVEYRAKRANSGANAPFLKKIDEAIAAAPQVSDAFVVFDVPGDGKFKITNTKERLDLFRKKIASNAAGFRPLPKRQPYKSPLQKKPQAGTASDETIREMLQSGDLTAALELSKVVGRPLVFGTPSDQNDPPLVKTHSEPIVIKGFKLSVGRSVPFKKSYKALWSVTEMESGAFIASGATKADAEKTAAEYMAPKTQEELRGMITKMGERGKGASQAELESRWLKWAEEEEYRIDNAEAIQQKADKERADKAKSAVEKWKDLTGINAAGDPLNPPSMDGVLAGYVAADKLGNGDKFLDYVESALANSDGWQQKMILSRLNLIRAFRGDGWSYDRAGSDAGRQRVEFEATSDDGRKISAGINVEKDLASGFVREDGIIKAKVGIDDSLTVVEARKQADKAIAALMKPAKKDPALTKDIPETVKEMVSWSVAKLRDIEKSLEGVERARGNGHILALELRDRQQEISKAQEKLSTFRQMAKDKGVDADGIIADLGGEPDFVRFGKPAPATAPAQKQSEQYRYALVNRPASMGAVPKVQFTVEPRPPAGSPHHDLARHGIMVTDRKLTDQEVESFELAVIADEKTESRLADDVAKQFGEYADQWIEDQKEDHRGFVAAVGQSVGRITGKVRYSIGNIEQFANAVLRRLNEAKRPAEPAEKPTVFNTEDAGSELTYNRRNRLTRGLKWEDIADKDEALRVKEVTKAKVYPKPDYQELIDGGMTPTDAYMVKLVYDSIAIKPNTRAAPSDADLRRYIDGVGRVMSDAVKWANDNTLSRASLLKSVYPNGWREGEDELRVVGGNKVLASLQPGYTETKRATKDIAAGWPASQEVWQRQGYKVINRSQVTIREQPQGRGESPSWIIEIDGRYADYLTEKATVEEKFPFEWMVIDKYRNVKGSADTEAKAKESARALASRAAKTPTISDKGINVSAAARTGADRRMPGEDISSDRLRETFKFKGVNFGNWMKGGANAQERQLHLNHAYDSFMDLAEVLDVPPEAMSLNGMLGVAIGAQGSGGFAAAHFVPGVNEINLTRESGAGSLAHEWAHALDHYFARQAGMARATDPFLTERLGAAPGAGIRPEIVAKFDAIVQAMRKRSATPQEREAKAKKGIADAEVQIGRWLREPLLDRGLTDDAEVAQAVEKIKAGELGDGAIAVSSRSAVRSAVHELAMLVKKKSGKKLSVDTMIGVNAQAERAKYLRDNLSGDAAHVPQQMVQTQYLDDAVKLDDAKGGKKYWSTSLEMFARAFDAFISDELESKAAKNTYLSHAGRTGATVPKGDERTAISAAIKGLVDAVETKEGEDGNVILYNVAPSPALSPSDSAVYQMAQEGKTAAEILAFLAKASRRPFSRVLAIALQKAGLQTSITVDPQGGWSVGNRSYAAKYAAAYSPKADKVALFTPRDAERHVLHELTHAATLKAINAGGAAAMRMTALFKHVEKSGKLEGMYGMSTLDEFVAEVFSNPRFRAALESVPAPAGSTLKTAWDWFVRIVARVLGFQSSGPHTALDRALRDGVALMDENAAIRAQAAGGDDRYAIASDRLKATRLFHSTANEDAAKQILADGIIKPPELKNSRGKLTPVVGRSYASKSLETAGIYSLGGVWMGREHGPERWTGRSAGRYGYVFEVDSAGLGDVQPDEDIVGELAARAIERKVDGLYWLASLAKRHGTERQLRNAIDGYYADQAQLGKKLLKYMTDDQKITLLDDYGAHVANDGPMRVVRAWKIDKSRSKEIARDGSNLLDIGEQVYGEKLDAIRAADEAVRFNAAEDLPTTITVDGVERPTTNSNGKPIHPTLDGVRNFWRWFQNSAVTDADGKPLRVFHGTASDITAFDIGRSGESTGNTGFYGAGAYFSEDADYASGFSFWARRSDDQAPNVVPVYLSLKNPAYINITPRSQAASEKSRATAEKIISTMIARGTDQAVVDKLQGFVSENKFEPFMGTLYNALGGGTGTTALLKEAGFDGVTIYGGISGKEKLAEAVAFDPTQIKSATANTGAFSPDDPDIRYNIAANWPSSALPQAKAIRDTIATALRSDANTSWITPFNTQYHKAEKWAADGKPLFKRVFNLVQQFLGDVSKYAVMAQNAAPTLLHEWRTVSDVKAALSGGDLTGRKHRADIAAVAMPLYDGTLYGGGNPLNGIKWSDERLRTKYKLTDRQIKLYHEALAAVNVSMDEMAKSVIAQHAKREKVGFDSGMDIDDMSAGVLSNLEDKKQEIMESVGEIAQESVSAQIADLKEMDRPDEADKLKREFDKAKKDAKADLERLDKTIGDINAIVAKNKALQAAGYFPLMRFGKHTVTAKDAEGKVQFFGMYDGIPLVPGSGQAEANRVAAQLKEEFPDWDVKTDIVNDQKYKLYQGVNLDALQLFAEHMEKDDVEPFQEFVRMATNNRSAQRRLLHRKGTPGFDKDVRRTMAQFITSNARATSSNYHTQDMLRAAAESEKDGGDIGAEAIKLVKYVQDPIEEAQALRGFLFFNFLGGSIASAMVNLTQTPAMTLPYLSKFEQAPALMRRTMAAARMAAGKPETIADQNLRHALMRAELDGVTAPQEIHQLMATAANNIFAGSRAANILLRGWGAPFAMAESFNRRIAFITAFKIGEGMGNSIKNKTGFDNAFDFAEDVVKQTQGIYNKGNRMNIGRGAVGATLVTFKQYSIMYLELLKRLPPKQRAIMVGVLLLSAGAGGLPGVDDLEDLWDTVGQWLGYATNSKRSIRNSLTEFAGAPIADVVLNGVLSRMGIDLHSRLGMQNLIPGTGILKQSSTDKGRDIEEFFGPAASVIKSAGYALENMATGRPGKAAMAVSPVAIRNAALGGKMAATGFAQDASGRNTVPVNEAEAFAKGIGFNPKSVAEFGSVKRDLAQDQRLVGVKREEFAAAMADAILNNDPEARLQAIKDLQEWNQRNPFHRVTITPESIAKRVRDARAEGATRMLRSLPKGMRTQAAEEFRQ